MTAARLSELISIVRCFPAQSRQLSIFIVGQVQNPMWRPGDEPLGNLRRPRCVALEERRGERRHAVRGIGERRVEIGLAFAFGINGDGKEFFSVE